MISTHPEIAVPQAPIFGRLRRGLMGISTAETRPARRGFRVDRPALEERLGRVGRTFLTGYHAALLDARPVHLGRAIDDQVDVGWRGFAYEGAGMALAILDTTLPLLGRRSSRLDAFLAGPGQPHRYLVHVGAGWSFARLPRRIARARRRLDPILGWLTLDGYGFHQGFFAHPRHVTERRLPGRLDGYARRAFDQGLGRSLWFVEGADAERLIATVETFDPERQGDLWSGIGLAAAYAGGLDDGGLERLRAAAGEHRFDLAQGAAFAAEAREAASDPAPHTDPACRVLCGTDAAGAARSTRVVRAQLGLDGSDVRDVAHDMERSTGLPAYEHWRRGIHDHFARGANP